MRRCKSAIILFLVPLFVGNVKAQSSAAFQSLIYPMSVSAQGLGEQGVASRNPIDAMTYNPANLVYENGVALSMYRNPWQILSESFGLSFPLESFAATAKINSIGDFGFEYTDWDLGEVTYTTAQGPNGGQSFHSYEQSFAGAYATQLNDEIAIGGQIRYVREPEYEQETVDHLLFSAGVGYKPSIFLDRINVGFSLMNFGTGISTGSSVDTVNGQIFTSNFSAPPPAQLNLGIQGLVVANDFFEVNLMAGAMKPLAKTAGPPNYSAQSSFKSLFNDWSDFPNDVTGQLGLGYIWHPIYLGGGVSYFQEMYVGYFSTGPKDLYNSFYTHGINVGVEACGIKATAGYAGRWLNNNAGSYVTWDFPWETFQFTLSTDERFLETDHEDIDSKNPMGRIVLSGGFGYGLFIGRMKGGDLPANSVTVYGSLVSGTKEETVPAKSESGPLPTAQPSSSYSLSPGPLFSVCSDFYFNDDAALTTSFAYTRIKGMATIYTGTFGTLPADLTMETLTITSGLRMHPLSFFHPFFVQGDIGIVRRNPIAASSPKYDYKSLTDLTIGALVPVLNSRVVLIPTVAFRTMFAESSADGSRLGGFNQFIFCLNAGYEF